VTLGGWAMRSVADAVKTNASLAETSANEFGAASRQSLALGPGSHSARAACARESRGWNWRSLSQQRFPGRLQRSEAKWKAIGSQRKTRREAAPNRTFRRGVLCERPSAGEMPRP